MLETREQVREGYAIGALRAVVRGLIEDLLILGIKPLQRPVRGRIHIRQVDGVTGAAHLRVLDVRVLLRLDAKRVLHRLCLDVIERPVQLVARAIRENAGRRIEQKLLQLFVPRHRVGPLRGRIDVVTQRATNSLTRQISVFVIRIHAVLFAVEAFDHRFLLLLFLLFRQRVSQPSVGGVVEVRILDPRCLLAEVNLQLPLTHRAVTTQTSVRHGLLVGAQLLFGKEAVLGVLGQKRELTLELREEDGIAPGKSHGRPAPLAELRNIEAVAVVWAGLRRT